MDGHKQEEEQQQQQQPEQERSDAGHASDVCVRNGDPKETDYAALAPEQNQQETLPGTGNQAGEPVTTEAGQNSSGITRSSPQSLDAALPPSSSRPEVLEDAAHPAAPAQHRQQPSLATNNTDNSPIHQKRDSVNSFATAPETAYQRNSIASTASQVPNTSSAIGVPSSSSASSGIARRDTAGSLSAMARIAEAAEDLVSPPQTRPQSLAESETAPAPVEATASKSSRSLQGASTSQPPPSSSSATSTPTPTINNAAVPSSKQPSRRQSNSSFGSASGSNGSRKSASRRQTVDTTDTDDQLYPATSASVSRTSSTAQQQQQQQHLSSSSGSSKRLSSYKAASNSPPVPQIPNSSSSLRQSTIADSPSNYRTSLPQYQSQTPTYPYQQHQCLQYSEGLSAPQVHKARSFGAESTGGNSSSQYHARNGSSSNLRSRELIPPVPLPGSNFNYAGGTADLSAGGSAQQRNSYAPGNKYIQQQQAQRSSVASHHLPTSSSAPYLYGAGIAAQQPYAAQAQQHDSIYSTSPLHLSDAGFGSSSPYPPIGGGSSSQQRYSQVGGGSSPIPQYATAPPLNQSAQYGQYQQPSGANMSTASLRPQPTTGYGSASRHLPEMHPSALEARPSVSAPFPPSTSPARNTAILAPAATQQRERVDASRPLGQEVCLECLMRDRDMADVEVTGPGIWSRASDLDFEEALRAEELALANAASNDIRMAGGGGGTTSSQEDNSQHAADHAGRRNGNASTEESFKHQQLQGGQIRSPSRESSLSEKLYTTTMGSNQKRQNGNSRRRKIGGGQPLLEPSLKLWTSMNQTPSSHRYKVLQDFVNEQNRYLALERHASEQSNLERERADRMLRDSPSSAVFGSQASIASSPTQPYGNGGISQPRASSDSRGRVNKKVRASQILPNGMTVETIDVAKDEKEAKSRARAAAKNRRSSAHSPTDHRRTSYAKSLGGNGGGAPSIRSLSASSPGLDIYATSPGVNGTSSYADEAIPSPTMPWLADQRRRFSSPMLSSSRGANGSTDNLGRSRGAGGGLTGGHGDSSTDLRMSTHSMMNPPRDNGFRSPSPSRFSVATGKTRESKLWNRKSLWNNNRSASASVLSFAHSGSMMEMHLGMSQDKHAPGPQYADDLYRDAATGQLQAGRTWPDTASVLDDSGGGISPDENLDAATNTRKKKKGFKKFFNSMFAGKTSGASGNDKSRRAATEGDSASRGPSPPQSGVRAGASKGRPEPDRRESSLSYAARKGAATDDYSEPLAPPPPLSFLTGQQPHRRSFSSSSQSSASPNIAPAEAFHKDGRPNSLAVPSSSYNTATNVGLSSISSGPSSIFISPSSPGTSSSDLNRPRPSSVTSWRSSSNKTSPQSPREIIAEGFPPTVAIAVPQDQTEELSPGLRRLTITGDLTQGGEVAQKVSETSAATPTQDSGRLRKEKSLPALPPLEQDCDNARQQQQQQQQQYDIAGFPVQQPFQTRPSLNEVQSAPVIQPYQQQQYYTNMSPADQQQQYYYDARYSPEYEEFGQGLQGRNSSLDDRRSMASKQSRKSKSKSKLFGAFMGGTNKRSHSHDDNDSLSSPLPSKDEFMQNGYAPHEVALQSVVRDNPTEMVAYRYPSIAH